MQNGVLIILVDMMSIKSFKNWAIITENDEEEKYLYENFIFLYDIFKEIFGEELLNKENCAVNNDKNGSYPQMTYHSVEKLLYITLNSSNLSYWAQLIYQLSHEMTHYLCRQYRNDFGSNYNSLSWFEETICEAISLFVLKIASEKWHTNHLSEINPKFSEALNDYYMNELSKKPVINNGDIFIKNISSLSELEYINNLAEDKRELRVNARNKTFDLLCSSRIEDIQKLIGYNDYIKENSRNLLIDFEKWELETKSPFIKSLSIIQPIIN
jgi:hypothetical protein